MQRENQCQLAKLRWMASLAVLGCLLMPALAKADSGLQTAIVDALDVLIADGSYKALLDKWQLSSDAIEKATINAGQ